MHSSRKPIRYYRNLQNHHGVILLTVILLIMIFSLIVVGIMSVNVSHVKTGEKVIDEIRVEELAKGLFYQKQQVLLSGEGTTPTQVDMGSGKSYNVRVDCQSAIGINDTGEMTVCIGDNCQVLCTPNCTGKQCGPNGCCGSCGPCSPPQVCQNGLCVTLP
jgi:hypothetical protein